MPSTYTLNNGIELIATGEQSGTWGDTTNTNLELLDTALDGQVTVTLASAGSSGSPNTLPISDGAASNGRNRMVIFDDSSDLGATAYVQLTPNDAEKIIYVRNSLSGGRDIILFQGTYSASNDYNLPNGTTAVIFFDGAGSGAVAANVLSTLQVDALNVESAASTTAITIDNTATDGDPILGFALSGTNTFTMGVDDGDSDKFKIGTTAIGTDTRLTIASNGDIAFLDDDGSSEGFLFDASNSAVTITNYDAGASFAPDLILFRDSASPLASDSMGQISFRGRDSGGATNDYIRLQGILEDPTATAEDGQFTIGILTAGTNRNRFSIDSSEVVINENGIDSDFRVESDSNANMLFVDAGEDAVKIGGTTTREGALQVFTTASGVAMEVESTNGSTSQGPILQLRRTSPSPAGNDYLGALNFVGQDSGNNALSYVDMYTRATTVTDGSEESQFTIRTRRNGTLEERFTLNAVEASFNEVGGDIDFRVESDGATHMLFVDASANAIGINSSNPDSGRYLHIEGGGTGIGLTLKDTAGTQFGIFSDANNLTFKNDTGGFNPLSITNSSAFNLIRNGTFAGTDSLPLNMWHYNDSGNPTGQILVGGTTNYTGDLVFKVRAGGTSGAGGAAIHEYMRMRGNERELVVNQDGLDHDFRVESDGNTHAVFVDAGSNKVIFGGNGTINGANGEFVLGSGASSATYFSIRNNTTSATTSASSRLDLGVWTNNAAYPTPSNTVTGLINFMAQGNDNAYAASSISSYVLTGGNLARSSHTARTIFYNKDNNASSAIEYMRLDGGEEAVVINQEGYDNDFRVESDSQSHMFFVDAGNDTVNIRSSVGSGAGHLRFDSTYIVGGVASEGSDTPSSAKISLFSGNNDHLIGIEDGGAYHTTNTNWTVYKKSSTTYNELMRLHTNSNGAVFNGDGEDRDFRVESDASTHAMNLDGGSGVLMLNTNVGTGVTGLSDPFLAINQNDQSKNGITLRNVRENYSAYTAKSEDNTGSWYFAYWVNASGTNVGSISATSSSSAFNTTSDYRLKENVVELTGATERLKQLQPKRFNFIIDPDKTVDGFLAHEAATVVPEAVTGEKDAVNDDGSILPQGIDNSKLVPLLVATIKELEARITALENA